MAYTLAHIKTALYEALGGGLAVDATKDAAVEKEIQEAHIECQAMLGPETTASTGFNALWFKLAMFRGCVVAIGPGQQAELLYKAYSDFLDAFGLPRARQIDTTTTYSYS